MNNGYIINVNGLRKSFDGKIAVKNVDLQVKKGEVFGFLGPNGSGKTTTIRMLCGLLTPDSGHGTCLGYDIISQSAQIKEHVGYMTQKYSFYTDLSVEENLHFMAQIYDMPDRKEQVNRIMEEFYLTDKRGQLTGQLSGGWKQRVALAACLIHKPDLLLLDEPTAGVDPIARREFWDKIHGLSEKGITILISTHYMDEAERCTRLAYLASGRILITGTVNEVIAKAKLHTWEISGNITTSLLKKVKQMEGITQAALFGNQIHICGDNPVEIEKKLSEFAKKNPIHWEKMEPTLEDAFINLVKESHGESY